MSNQTSSAGTSVVTLDTPSFLTGSLDLKDFVRQLKPSIKNAVELLIKQLTSQDEKIAQNAAKALLEFNLTAKKELNQDQLQRMIAEFKVARRIPLQRTSDDDMPRVDFDEVQELG